MTFDLGLSDVADITVGYASYNSGGVDEEDSGNMHTNISGSFSGWSVNVLYMTDTDDAHDAATGIDLSGGLMGATINASMNTDFEGDEMTSYGLSYAVNDDMSVSVNSTTYSEEGAFSMAGTNMDGSWMETGGMGYLNANDEDLSYGLSYNLGGISLSATMHNITNAGVGMENYERSVTEVGIGYSLGDNAGLGISYATDATEGGDDNKYTWVTLSVTP